MKKFIIITSINEPTTAVSAFAAFSDHELIVVGDAKTNPAWKFNGANYLSVEAQNNMDAGLGRHLPYHHYSRKMLGYLLAIKAGADTIIDADDDIIPKAQWQFPEWVGEFDCIASGSGFVNIYRFFTDQFIWPRGLPLKEVMNESKPEISSLKDARKVGIWQGLSDIQPDVDAIYRLTNNRDCIFNVRVPLVLGPHTISPINSQNTAFGKAAFPLLYLPTQASFRFTDILRGYVAQPILWLYNLHIGFTGANTIQKRNPHNNFEDFLDEMTMYQHAGNITNIVLDQISGKNSIEQNLFNAYEGLARQKIISEKELPVLEAWLKDLQDMKGE
ncbi:MAG: STELLO glycosyltransferase family protein [Chitinophagales bacterium]